MSSATHLSPSNTAYKKSEEYDAQLSRLRHDIRGILSPALLMADKLAFHEDESVKKAAQIITDAIELAAQRLSRQS